MAAVAKPPALTPQDEEKLVAKLSSELLSCQSYWQRRIKIMMLRNSGLSEKKIKMVEFDLNLNFQDVDGVVENVTEMFKTYPKDEEVNTRLKKFMESLLGTSNKAFTNEVIMKIPSQTLLDMFFHVYPNKRSAVGTLSVYFLLSNSNAQSLKSIGKRIFEAYQAAREQYAKEESENFQKTGGLTPYDLLLFHLARPLSESNFGDLDVNQVALIYITMISCCVADAEKRLSKSFYGCGIENLPQIHPAQEWNSCVLALVALFHKRDVLIPAIANLKASGQSLTIQNLSNAIFSEGFDLQGFPEISRLLLSYAYSKSLPYLKDDILVRTPAHLYNISYDSVTQIWPHEVKPQKIFESALNSVKANVDSEFAECLEITQKLVESTINNPPSLLQFLESCKFERIYSLVGYALLVAGQYQLASTFLKTAIVKPDMQQKEYLIITVQIIQANLALRDFLGAYELITVLLDELVQNERTKIFVPIIPNDEDYYILIKEKAMLNYLTLMLFHIIWCIFVKQDNHDARDFTLYTLTVIAQSIWEFQGYALFPYILKHISKRRKIFFPEMSKHISNYAILSQLLNLNNVQFMVNSETKELLTSTQLRSYLNSSERPKESPVNIMMHFLKFYREVFMHLLKS